MFPLASTTTGDVEKPKVAPLAEDKKDLPPVVETKSDIVTAPAILADAFIEKETSRSSGEESDHEGSAASSPGVQSSKALKNPSATPAHPSALQNVLVSVFFLTFSCLFKSIVAFRPQNRL